MRYICQAVPQRRVLVERIQPLIPGLEVHYDHYRDPMGAFIRSLEMMNDEPCVFIEDDIILCERFTERAEEAIAQYPDDMISFFFLGNKTTRQPARVAGRTFCMMQSIHLPAGCASKIIPFVKARYDDFCSQDLAVRDWLAAVKRKYILWYPCLVQHRAVKSASGSRSKHRQAIHFNARGLPGPHPAK